MRRGRGRNGPSAIAGQLETLGGCAGSGVQVLKGCVSYPAKLSAAPHAQPSRNEKDANSFGLKGNGYRAGVKSLPLPTFPLRSRQGRSARHPAPFGQNRTAETPMGNHAAMFVPEEHFCLPGQRRWPGAVSSAWQSRSACSPWSLTLASNPRYSVENRLSGLPDADVC